MLSAKNVFVLTESRLCGLTAYLEIEHDIIHKLMLIKQ